MVSALALDELRALLAPRADHYHDRLATVIVTGVGVAAIGLLLWRYGAGFEALAYSGAVAGLIPLVIIDLRHHRLPREITYTTTAACALVLGIDARSGANTTEMLLAALLGAAIYVAALAVISLATGGSIGAGDVRLGILLGTVLGYRAAVRAGWGLATGFGIAALVGFLLLVMQRIDRRASIPFGPALAAGAVTVLLVDGP
jgi:leader peptidase (prepilin peptidase)/N-methyltransferase